MLVAAFTFSTMQSFRRLSTLAVKFERFGNPQSVLSLQHTALQTVAKGNDVIVKMLAAPINPSDINMIEGVYGISPKLPSIAGNEGVAIVTNVGEKVKSVKIGDWVVPAGAAFGTWRSGAVANEDEFIKVPNDIPAAYAASLTVNPSTAYRLLRDFQNLQKGDVIIQNGANSAVGLAVVQMARELGIRTVNVIRADRPDPEQTLRLLCNLGGDVNVLDTQLNSHALNEVLAGLPAIRLALNCVGGDVCSDMARVLAPGGTLVSYGGMSRQPISIAPDLLAYKQLTVTGFWMSAWHARQSNAARAAMFSDISELIRSKKLSLFFEMHDFDDFSHALKRSLEPHSLRKIVLNMDYPDRLKEHDSRPASDYELFETTAV